jgi:predicted glycosyltransferase
VRIWIDMTAPAHVLVFRPIIRRLEEAGHEVAVTARDYGEALSLLTLHGIEHTAFGRHGGVTRRGKVRALGSRLRSMRRFGRAGRFDLAAAHASNELPIAARSLGVPVVDMFDYEWALQQHNVGCRLARRVMTPDAIPPERLRRYGVGSAKLAQFPGLKEDYYLFDFEPDRSVLDRLGLDPDRVIVVVRPPADVALYHRLENTLFPRLLERLGRDERVQALVVPRNAGQREYVHGLGLPSLVVPDHAVDAQSLIALADLVISAGGTMNREAVSLGTPVYTTFAGRPGGVDEDLVRRGMMRGLTDPDDLVIEKRSGDGARRRRDPQVLADMMLATA